MSEALISRATDISKKADLNHKHLSDSIISETSVLGKLSTFVAQPNRISSSGGVYKNGIYFFPNAGGNSYSYVAESDFESGVFTSILVDSINRNIFLTDNTESETEIYMVSGMQNSGSPNTSMVYTIDTNNPSIFKGLTFPNTDSNPYAIKCFKENVILFMNGGDIFVSSDKCQSWSKIINFKKDLNIDVSSGGRNILVSDDTLYICGFKNDTYPNYESHVIYTKDLSDWKSASCPDISRFNNIVKFNDIFVLSTGTANKLITTKDFESFSIIEGVPSNFVQSTGKTLYAMNQDNLKIMKSTKDLREWISYELTSNYPSVNYIFGYVGKYIVVNDQSDVKPINYLMDYTEVRPLTISQGGTNATTAEIARKNLEVPINKTITNQMTDFNDYTEVGFYSLYNPLYNVPDTNMSGNYSYSLIVLHGIFKNGTYDVDQIAVSQNGDIYVRHYSRSFGTWYSWQRLNNTNVKPLEIIKGGTGASSSEKARVNLDVYSKIEVDSKLNSTNNTMNIYVESSGNDQSGDGSQENPYASISKAISIIPKNINHAVVIHIGQGTFEMPINSITGFNGSGDFAIVGQDTITESKTIISNKLRFGYNTIRKIWLGNMTFQYSNSTTTFDDIVDITGIIEFNTLTFKGTQSNILQAPLKIYNVPNAVIESCKFDYADNAIALIGTTRGYVNNCTVNNCNYAVATFSGAMAILRSAILGNTNNVYKQADSGSSIVYPNGSFSEF